MIPHSVKELAADPDFWNAFHFWEWHEDLREFPQLDGCLCRFSVGAGSALTLSLDPGFGYLSLSLESPLLSAPVEVGWDDQAHFHPDVLRWSELEAICTAVAATEHDAHPGLPLLLLSRFAPICVGDDVEFIVDRLAAAWRAVAPGVPTRVVRTRIEDLDRRRAAFEWSREPEVGWVPKPGRKGLHSLRSVQNPEFPFKAWNEFIAQAESVSLKAATPPSPPSSITLRRRYAVEIRTLIEEPSRWRALNKALAAADLGTATPAGGTYGASSKRLSDVFSVEVNGDLNAGLAVIRHWLADVKAPPNTTLECEGREYAPTLQ